MKDRAGAESPSADILVRSAHGENVGRWILRERGGGMGAVAPVDHAGEDYAALERKQARGIGVADRSEDKIRFHIQSRRGVGGDAAKLGGGDR